MTFIVLYRIHWRYVLALSSNNRNCELKVWNIKKKKKVNKTTWLFPFILYNRSIFFLFSFWFLFCFAIKWILFHWKLCCLIRFGFSVLIFFFFFCKTIKCMNEKDREKVVFFSQNFRIGFIIVNANLHVWFILHKSVLCL